MTNIENSIDCKQLLESVDFFAQNLSFEQIVSYGYQFLHNMLNLKSSAIYVLKEHQFELQYQTNAEFSTGYIEHNGEMKKLATRFGRAMQKELPEYFASKFLEDEDIAFAFPILVKDDTVALIFSKNTELNLEDREFAEFVHGINQLVNKAAENALNFKHFQNANATLDRKVFNLLFINHSTKALMSELDINRLNQLCIDVISELTASSVTSFGLYDPHRNRLILKGYKDIISYSDYYCELLFNPGIETPQQMIYHLKEDYGKLSRIFHNPEVFKTLKAEYVVLIVKKEILGFVTIGENINGKQYSDDLLGQIESLSSSIYIAITNAQYIQKIEVQKQEIKAQVEMLSELNKAIKNINSSESVEELLHITLQTIHYGFGVEKAMILLTEKGELTQYQSLGFDANDQLKLTETFYNRCKDQVFFEPLSIDLKTYVDTGSALAIGDSNCMVSVPLLVDQLTDDVEPLGYLMVYKTKTKLHQGQIVVLDAIGNSISPILKQLKTFDKMKESLVENKEYAFLQKLKDAFFNREHYYTDFDIYYKRYEYIPFVDKDLSAFDGFEVYDLGTLVLHIAYDSIEGNLFDGKITVFDEAEFLEEIKLLQ